MSYHATQIEMFCKMSRLFCFFQFNENEKEIHTAKLKKSILPATCWDFIGPAFIMNGSPPSKAMIGSAGWPCPLFPLPLWLDSLMIFSKSAASPLEDSPFWCLVGWTPLMTGAASQDTELRKKHGCNSHISIRYDLKILCLAHFKWCN